MNFVVLIMPYESRENELKIKEEIIVLKEGG